MRDYDPVKGLKEDYRKSKKRLREDLVL